MYEVINFSISQQTLRINIGTLVIQTNAPEEFIIKASIQSKLLDFHLKAK